MTLFLFFTATYRIIQNVFPTISLIQKEQIRGIRFSKQLEELKNWQTSGKWEVKSGNWKNGIVLNRSLP